MVLVLAVVLSAAPVQFLDPLAPQGMSAFDVRQALDAPGASQPFVACFAGVSEPAAARLAIDDGEGRVLSTSVSGTEDCLAAAAKKLTLKEGTRFTVAWLPSSDKGEGLPGRVVITEPPSITRARQPYFIDGLMQAQERLDRCGTLVTKPTHLEVIVRIDGQGKGRALVSDDAPASRCVADALSAVKWGKVLASSSGSVKLALRRSGR